MNEHLQKQIVFAIGLYILFISSIWFLLYIPSQQLQRSWESELDRFLESSSQLTLLVDDFGYGGFLVNFRSFLKTRDTAQLDIAIENLGITKSRLEKLIALNQDSDQITHLVLKVETSVDNYIDTAKTLKRNLAYSAFMSYSIVKRKITKQDPNILYALDKLVKINSAKLNEVKTKTIELKQRNDHELLYWVIGASLFYFMAAIINIMLSKSFRTAYSQLATLNEHSPTANLLFNEKGHVLQINRAFRQIFAITEEHKLKDIALEQILPSIYKQSLELFDSHQKQNKDVMHFIIDANRTDRKSVPVEVTVSLVEMNSKQVAFCIINDKSKEEKLQQKARTDSLTNVFNRGYAEELIDIELTRFKRSGQAFCVMLIDVDYFKRVNDSLGHNAGDKLLLSLVSLFKKSLRESDLIARWGGDEFLIVLPNTSFEYANIVAKKLVHLAQYAFVDDSDSVKTSISIGVAFAERDDTVTSFVKKADEALYVTKSKGRNGYTLHNQIAPET